MLTNRLERIMYLHMTESLLSILRMNNFFEEYSATPGCCKDHKIQLQAFRCTGYLRAYYGD